MRPDADISPQSYASGLYLIIIVAGLFTELGVRSTLLGSRNAIATAHAIMAFEQIAEAHR